MEGLKSSDRSEELALALEEQELNARRIELLSGVLERKSGVDLERKLVVESGGDSKSYSAKGWLTTKGWLDNEGKAKLDTLGTTINEIYELKDEHVFSSLLEFDKTVSAEETQLKKIGEELVEMQTKYDAQLKTDEDAAKIIKEYLDSLQKDKADAEASLQRLNEARSSVMKDLGELAEATVRVTGTGADTEGEAINPNILVASFPGAAMQHLFRILKLQLCLDMSAKGDCYVMNEKSRASGSEKAALPASWNKELGSTAAWKELTDYLVTLKDESGAEAFKAGGLAPAWFVDSWGPAALSAASKHGSSGSGVIVFQGWQGYSQSSWCKLEFLFCKCLSQKFPESVYLVSGYDVLGKKSIGAFMKGDETL